LAIQHPLKVRLAPFVSPRDLALLRTWLHRPHVARWWGDPEEVLSYVGRHPTARHGLIEVDGEPVGYLCWQKLSAQELSTAGLGALPVDHVDIDILIGEDHYLGQGVGPQALLTVAERLRSTGVSSVGLAADLANRRARRAFEKAGFRLCHTFEEEGREICYFTGVPQAERANQTIAERLEREELEQQVHLARRKERRHLLWMVLGISPAAVIPALGLLREGSMGLLLLLVVLVTVSQIVSWTRASREAGRLERRLERMSEDH
jgi:aminoglycoside 6'-N-acetyltransferase